MRFRLLKYCCGIWDDFLRSAEAKETPDLPPIVPLVFYQGESRWHHTTEFSELFAEPARRWPWTPQFEHLLVDQSQADVGAVPGETLGRAAQLALMAAARRELREALAREALARTVRLMGELDRAGQGERFRAVVFYVLHTQDKETLREFFAALRREVRGPGGDMMTYAEELIREGRQEGELKGRQEGELKGRQEGRVEGRVEGREEGRVEGRQGRPSSHDREFSARRRRVADHRAGDRHRPGGIRVAPPPELRVRSGVLTQFSHPTGRFSTGPWPARSYSVSFSGTSLA